MSEVKDFVSKNKKLYRRLGNINFKYSKKNQRIINLDINFIKIKEMGQYHKNSGFSLSKLNKNSNFSKSEEIECLEKYTKTKDEKILEKLVKENIPFLINISKKYASMTGVDSEDLLSSGCEGLLRAIKVYVTSNCNFSYLVKSYIKNYIFYEIIRSKGIKRGEYSCNYLNLFLKMKSKSIYELDSVQDFTDQIVNKLIENKKIKKMEKQEVLNIVNIAQASLFSELNEEELISEDTSSIAIDKVYNDELRENLLRSFSILNEKERFILEREYGLFSPPQLQSQISKELNLTRSYVSRTSIKALRKLRIEPNDSILEEFLAISTGNNNIDSKKYGKLKK